jgi:hypothetical protein
MLTAAAGSLENSGHLKSAEAQVAAPFEMEFDQKADFKALSHLNDDGLNYEI